MIDNVYELKQRFVGFNKVKLLTVVFYCMAYSWCSFLNEYNAMDNQEEGKEEEKKEEPKEKKGIWKVEEDAIVYEGDKFMLIYRWDDDFWGFIDVQCKAHFILNNNAFPAGYELASNLVDFLYRHQGALGIYVKREVEYRKVKRKELPGCCKFCCNGKLGDEALKRLYTEEKKNGLAERILFIGPRTGESSNEARKQWLGGLNMLSVNNSLKSKKLKLLAVIAKLFDQDAAGIYGQSHLLLSYKVKKLIHSSPGYSKVSFNDYMSLQGVIVVENDNNDENV